ncbi:MAG: HAMP domain-containing histidine kinase, partial [Cyclobacteriaceae bacterium]|nr:HAMP domain-containing histidine kinase [Cyclobacteriaceae bacterium]
RIKDETGLAESYNKIGFLCLENGETQRAIDNLLLGQSNAELVNSNALMQQSFDYLYQAYFSQDDYKKALFYQNKFMNISELIYAEDNERKIEENNNKNEIEKREQEIESLRVISERTEKQLATSKKFIFTLALLLVVILVSVVFFVKSYRDKKKFNKKLQRINKKVVEQNKKLTELNSTKDKFFSIIGHDLKGPLNSLTSFSQLLINHTASLTEEEIRTIAKDLDKSLKNLYELLDNLLGWARSQTGRIEFKPENYKIADLVRENIRLLSKAALNKNIKVEMLVDEEVFVFVDVNSIRTVIRNLLSNAIKFTNEDGVISIFADEWKDKVEIGIHDTGVGMRK